MKSHGVLIFGSILAALQFLAGAAALGDLVGDQVFGLFVIVVGAVQVGWAAYQQQQVVPYQDTAAFVNKDGHVVAGPAAGVTNGKSVEVVKTEFPASEGDPGMVGRHHNEYGRIDPLYAALIVFVVVVTIWLLASVLPLR